MTSHQYSIAFGVLENDGFQAFGVLENNDGFQVLDSDAKVKKKMEQVHNSI
jgi:hypothetical protein